MIKYRKFCFSYDKNRKYKYLVARSEKLHSFAFIAYIFNINSLSKGSASFDMLENYLSRLDHNLVFVQSHFIAIL
jgi:hypothetical protein